MRSRSPYRINFVPTCSERSESIISGKTFYLIIILLTVTFLYSELPAKDALIEITQIKVVRDSAPGRDLKMVNSVSCDGKTNLKPATIMDFWCSTRLETLMETTPVEIARLSVEFSEKKFSQTLPVKLVLPPGRYFIGIAPSVLQKNANISFSDEDRVRLAAQKGFVIGTPEERIDFMQKEYKTACQHLETLQNIYKELKDIIDKSEETKIPPADDSYFKQWQTGSLAKVNDIDNKIREKMRSQGYLTYYTSSYSKLHSLTALLQNQLQSLLNAVITASREKRSNLAFSPDEKSVLWQDESKNLLTRETILDLTWFLYALAEDMVIYYEEIKNMTDSGLKDLPARMGILAGWQEKDGLYEQYLKKSEEFISNFKPLIEDIWQKHTGELHKCQKVMTEMLEAYRKIVQGDKSEELSKKLETLKQEIVNHFAGLRPELNK